MRLRLIATSDLHAHLVGWDYDTDQAVFGQGLARVADLIKRARAEQENTLLFDNGDFLNGSPLGDYVAARPGMAHPMIAAMNLLGYDAATLGNHEFSEGLPHLLQALAAARFPVVSSNLHPESGPAYASPSVILDRTLVDRSGQIQLLKVGVLGFMPPQTRLWEADHLQDRFAIEDILTAARREVPRLRAQRADLVVVLAHSGLQTCSANGDGENVARALSEIPDIDAVFSGHVHEAYPAQPISAPKGQAAPVVMPGFFGSHLAVIDLDLRFGESGWTVVSHRSEARPVAVRHPQNGVRPLVAERPEIKALARPAHTALRAQGRAQIGDTPQRLHSYFAKVQPSPALQLVASAQRCHLKAALANGPYAHLPILSAVAPFKAGGRGGPENYTDIAAGGLSRRHGHDLYLHPNYLVAFRLTGVEVVDWLERSAGLFNQITASSTDQRLINPNFPGFNFDVLHGVSYQIDLSQPARYDEPGNIKTPEAGRLRVMWPDGTPLDPAAPVVLASNSFRLAGGGGFSGGCPENVIYRSDVPVQSIVLDHIRAGRAGDGAGGSWGFRPMAGTAVVYETSPVAETLLDEIARFRPERLGRQENGFHAFRLWL